MKRAIDVELNDWKERNERKVLLVRGPGRSAKPTPYESWGKPSKVSWKSILKKTPN